jgi:pimeloyl-ACP methyl ester carboxylesterase
MPISQVCFSHGQESGPWGSKITALAAVARAQGLAVESLDYRHLPDTAGRVERLCVHLATLPGPALLVGSSMGGYVALQAARRLPVAGLFLLAPALFLPGYEDIPDTLPGVPVTIVHGWHDAVVPWQGSVRFAEQLGAELVLLDGDHRLTAALSRISEVFGDFLRRQNGVRPC